MTKKVNVLLTIKITDDELDSVIEVLGQYMKEKYDVLEDDPGYEKLLNKLMEKLTNARKNSCSS